MRRISLRIFLDGSGAKVEAYKIHFCSPSLENGWQVGKVEQKGIKTIKVLRMSFPIVEMVSGPVAYILHISRASQLNLFSPKFEIRVAKIKNIKFFR